MQPGLHELSHHAYHSDPCPTPSLSSSLGKKMLERSPLYAWHNHPRLGMAEADKAELPRSRATSYSRKMCLGQAAHAVILEDTWDNIEICEFADFRKKDAKEQRDDAIDAGRIPILEDEVEAVHAMRDALEANEWCTEMLAGEREKSLTWIEHLADVGEAWMRCRIDVLKTAGAIVDFKTTELAPTGDGWGRRQIWEYALQVGLYRWGAAQLFEGELVPFRFVVQEVAPPYGAACFEFPGEAYEYADNLADRAIRLWIRCVAEQSWPGYAPGLIVPDAPYYIREALKAMEAERQIGRAVE